MTDNNDAPQGFLNNAIVGLLILFTIPAVLVVGGFVLVAQLGGVPGGETTTCERQVTDATTIRIETYAYTAGLTNYTQETFFAINRGDEQQIMQDTVQAPRMNITCDNNIQVFDNGLILFSPKSIAIRTDENQRWQVHNICDDPRPESGRCDADPLNIVAVNFTDATNGQIRIEESIVDEYGQPISEDGDPLIAEAYILTTRDGGISWQVQTTE